MCSAPSTTKKTYLTRTYERKVPKRIRWSQPMRFRGVQVRRHRDGAFLVGGIDEPVETFGDIGRFR